MYNKHQHIGCIYGVYEYSGVVSIFYAYSLVGLIYMCIHSAKLTNAYLLHQYVYDSLPMYTLLLLCWLMIYIYSICY